MGFLKVVELENKLKQQEENHSTTYQKKVITIVTQLLVFFPG